MSARWMAVAAATLVIVAILAASWMLRTKPATVSVGDEALLEIYTLHAAHGVLRVGPYSRFQWNHPGPALFYLLAPGYAASGFREDSLFATSLIVNLACAAVLLLCLRRFGGAGAAYAAVLWLGVLYFRTGHVPGWDFGDLLGSSWNPHIAMLPLAILVVLCAALASGELIVLPAMTAVASLVVQTHVGFLPVSAAVSLSAIGVYALTHTAGRPEIAPSRVPAAAVVLDVLGAVYLLLLAWVLLLGGFDFRLGSHTVTVNSTIKLATSFLVLWGIRHLLSRRHPRLVRLMSVLRSAAWLPPRHDLPSTWTRAIPISLIVLFGLWLLPLTQELFGPGPGNLWQLMRFMSEPAPRNTAAALAAFTLFLSGVARPGFEVAAGGRIITGADLDAYSVVVVIAQVAGLVVAFRWSARRGTAFHSMLCAMCLVATVAGLWSMLHVRDDIFDHIAFWLSIVGVLNLTAITATAFEWLRAGRGAVERLTKPVVSLAIVAMFVVALSIHGTRHLVLGHQQARFAADVAATADLVSALRARMKEDGHDVPVLVNMTLDTWSVAAGVVLELYKAGSAVTVAPEWTFLFGHPLAATGREGLEAMIVEDTSAQELQRSPGYQPAGESGRIRLFVRVVSRADRVRLRQAN